MTTDPAALLRDYLDAGLRMDLAELERTYAPEFVNLRVDLAGRTMRITREQLVDALRDRVAQGLTMPPVDDVEMLSTSTSGRSATVVFRRVKHGSPLVYTFVWDVAADPPVLVHEITTEAVLDRFAHQGTG